jgi:ribonuclease-3
MTITKNPHLTDIQLPSPLPDTPVISDQLYDEAFRHASTVSPAHPRSYERLSSLGSACLGAAVTRLLYESRDGKLDKGKIDMIRSRWVTSNTIEKWARAYKFQDRIQAGPLVDLNDNRILKDVFHAFLAAIWLTLSMDQVTEFLRKLLQPELAKITVVLFDPLSVTKLLARMRSLSMDDPVYVETEDASAGLEGRYVALCTVRDKCLGRGTGRSKKTAACRAAECVMKMDIRDLTKKLKPTSQTSSEE